MSDSKSPAAVVQDVVALSEPLDLATVGQFRPRYNLTRLTQQSGGETVNITLGGSTTSIFDIPAVVHNNSESCLEFKISYPADGASKRIFLPADCIPQIQAAQLQTIGGRDILNHQYLPQWQKTCLKYETRVEDLVSASTKGALYASNLAVGSNYRYDGSSSDISYIENDYVRAGGSNAVFNVYYRIPLPQLCPGSILASKKNVYYGQPVRLTLTWAPKIAHGWTAESDTNPSTTVAAIASADAATVSGLRLYIAQESNENNISAIVSKYREGSLKYLIDFPWHAKTPLADATTHTTTIRVSRGMGQRLRKIYHALFKYAEEKNTRFETTRMASDGKYLGGSYYTQLDNRRIQQFNVSMGPTDATTGTGDGADEDYMLMQPFTKGSAIASINILKYNWAHIESFDEFESARSRDKTDSKTRKGLDLTHGREVKFDFYLTLDTSAPLNHYDFCVFERELMCSPSGIFVDGS